MAGIALPPAKSYSPGRDVTETVRFCLPCNVGFLVLGLGVQLYGGHCAAAGEELFSRQRRHQDNALLPPLQCRVSGIRVGG